MTRTAVYVRIREDRHEGAGVHRHEEACRDRCTRRGWDGDMVEVYRDNDLSASKGLARPAYQVLLQAVRDRQVAAVVAWHTNRLTQRMAELVELVELVTEAGVQVTTVAAGALDLPPPRVGWSPMCWARWPRRRTSEQMRAEQWQAARRGAPLRGRSFGYERGMEGVPEEAKRIREAAEQVLASDTLDAIRRDWTAQQVPTVRGARWSTTAIRTVLVAPRVAGLRVHRARWSVLASGSPSWTSPPGGGSGRS